MVHPRIAPSTSAGSPIMDGIGPFARSAGGATGGPPRASVDCLPMTDTPRRAPLVVGLAVAALLAAAPTPARADCAVPPAPSEAMASAQVAFVGVVTAVADNAQTATFDVQEIWKGPNLADPITVYGGGIATAGSAAEGRSWTPGARYLVFPTVDADGNLIDSMCSPTSLYTAALDALRPATAHEPLGPPTSGPPGAPPIAGIFLVILVLGSIGAFFLYRTGQLSTGSE